MSYPTYRMSKDEVFKKDAKSAGFTNKQINMFMEL